MFLKHLFPKLIKNYFEILIFVFGTFMLCVLQNLQQKGNLNFRSLHNDLQFDKISVQFNKSFQFNPPNITAERKDWHNVMAMAADEKRVGPGEHGEPFVNLDKSKKDEKQKLFQYYHYNAMVSELISANRSVPKIKIEACFKKEYLYKLPTVSIVITCSKEFDSALQRTLLSILNRTPKELLKEIILMYDNKFPVNKVLDYVKNISHTPLKFPGSAENLGLMQKRNLGASIAKGDVLVFFDSYIECNHNWLPPLLEPIAINEGIATSPVIDTIDNNIFAYEIGDGWRTGFLWDLSYVRYDLHTGKGIDPSKPYKDVIINKIFAISRRYFWQLGGYYVEPINSTGSEDLEQLELSLKIGMCGGMCLIVPCSHVGHISVNATNGEQKSEKNVLLLERHKKRIAEVWMDEFKQQLYSKNPKFYDSLYVGDLTDLLALRKNLQCKSFEWFMNFIAPDFVQQLYPPDFANGTVQSLALSTSCLDNMYRKPISKVGARNCTDNRQKPHSNQMWNLNFRQELRNSVSNICLDKLLGKKDVVMRTCHKRGGRQFWYYDNQRNWLINGENGFECMEAVRTSNGIIKIVLNECNEKKLEMKWIFGFVNNQIKPQRTSD